MALLVLFVLATVAMIWIVLPAWVASTKRRIADLERQLKERARDADQVENLTHRVVALEAKVRSAEATSLAAPVVPAPVTPAPPVAARPPTPVVEPPPARVEEVPTPPRLAPKPTPAAPPPITPPATPPVRPLFPPVAPAAAAQPAKAPFDWESLIGVRLFAAVAGIALVVAAVFFLRYSIERGWLEPQVRVAIGVLTAIGLLVVCELKAARKYPVTANALDAAAIAILFSTFFAAHALWNLIPAAVTFVLLALVTVVAVLLSIRRESLFIAVLGLLGGFLTPALLSTGQNQPFPLFSYLFLLNVGLAWVAYQKRWPVLTVLSTLFTTVYQWGWVLNFLDESSLPLAMGIFVLFPAAAVAGIVLGTRRLAASDPARATFERTGLVATAVPLVFSLYLAAIPAYGAQTGLLFGFLLLIDAGLLAVAVARSEERLHLVGGIATLFAVGIWLGQSYAPPAWTPALIWLTLLVLLYAMAPWIATRLGRPFTKDGAAATYTAPLLLFAFVVLAQTAQAASSPALLFATLFALAVVIAWRAIASSTGKLYFVAAFFVLAAEAAWSAEHLTSASLGTAIALYGGFGLLALGVPVAARRANRPLQPANGSGIVLLASLGLLLFLALSPLAPEAIWGLAILLAILNAALFVESASGRLPAISIIGGLASWGILAIWWTRAAAVVGLVPSLLVVILLALVMLAGHAWAHARAPMPERAASETTQPVRFRDGLFLGLVGHVFLFFVAGDPQWALSATPLFSALAVLTLAVSVVSLSTRVGALHAGGVVAASAIVATFAASSASAAQAPWPLVTLGLSAAVAAYALLWIPAWPRGSDTSAAAATGAGAALFIGEVTAIIVANQAGAPGVGTLILAHVANLSAILVLARRRRWALVAPMAVAPAWLAVILFETHHPASDWGALLALSGALYLVFAVYPFALGRRIGDSPDSHIPAVLASAFFLLAGRMAFIKLGLSAFVGAVPVAEGAVMALLLRQVLRFEVPGARDPNRLVIVAGAALALITVAIPLQLHERWITIGWALEGAALAWLATRVPHRGLVWSAMGLFAVVFVRLALNPAVLSYEPRGSMPILNWYLYTYALCAVAMLTAARWLVSARGPSRTGFGEQSRVTMPGLLRAAGVVLLFLLLNIEIADFYSTGPEISFQFSATLAQDLTYTIGWLIFGLAVLAAGIATHSRGARIAALALIIVTTFKCFVLDLRTLEGLYRVASFVGLAMSLALVSILLQKYVLAPAEPKAQS